MCSLKSASNANFGIFPSEQLEDDFITNLFSQSVNCPEAIAVDTNNGTPNMAPTESAWPLVHQIDHDYVVYTEPSPLLSPAWEEPIKTSSNSLNMSTYFSTFDPSTQFQTNQQQFPVIQHKLNATQALEKIHRARINLVSTTNGLKAIVKRKRKRTVFRTEQVEAMETVFAKKPYVTKEDRKLLVDKLNISDKSVKVWFQNRRLKNKRGEDQYFSEDENRCSPGIDRLDYVESIIGANTNEFGYVTLDDRIMSDLVKVIDEYLLRSQTDIATEDLKIEVADISMEETKIKTKYEYEPVYEPISPASTTDNSTEESSRECQSPIENEYLQRLIDIESIISK